MYRLVFDQDPFLVASLTIALFSALWALLFVLVKVSHSLPGYKSGKNLAVISEGIADTRSRLVFDATLAFWPALSVACGLGVLLAVPYRLLLVSLTIAFLLQVAAIVLRTYSIRFLAGRGVIKAR